MPAGIVCKTFTNFYYPHKNKIRWRKGSCFLYFHFNRILFDQKFQLQGYEWSILLNKVAFTIRGTLMQIWKSPYMFVFIQNQYPENFAFLILTISDLIAREFLAFFSIFLNICKQTFHMSHVRIS